MIDTQPRVAEYFASDIHGEYAAFSHVLRGGCGIVRDCVRAVLGKSADADELQQLTALICYPEERIALMAAAGSDPAVIAEELLPQVAAVIARMAWHRDIDAALERADAQTRELVNALMGKRPVRATREALIDACRFAQHLAVGHLHLVGDIYDRGPRPDLIIDELIRFPSIDIQWGNHDMLWMGAALGQLGCVANVVRICARYANLDVLADIYGIDLGPLYEFAATAYASDPCAGFALKSKGDLDADEVALTMKVQKAMAIMQFKVEAALIDEYPCFGLADRKQLHTIDWQRGTVEVDGVEYELTDTVFPTVDPEQPYALTEGEAQTLSHLSGAFRACEKLQRHIRFLVDNGSMYSTNDEFLMLHACVPLNDDGTCKEAELFGKRFAGKALYDECDRRVRDAFKATKPNAQKRGADLIWWLWLGPGSPLFAKSKMATFELYLIAEKVAREEKKSAFYKLFDQPQVYEALLEEFGLDPQTARIVCGHVPVKAKDGEDPVKAGGKVICIDGGFSAAYQKTTGLAGYTLVRDAESLTLYAHEPLSSREEAVAGCADIHSTARIIERY